MLDPIVITTIFGLTLGYILARVERHLAAQPSAPTLDDIARRVWPKLQDWRDRELSEALAHPDATRQQLITRIWRRRVGLRPHEHLGKRLLRQRERLGIPINDAALALQEDSHTVRSMEAGDAIPPRLSRRLRTYLAQLEAQSTPAVTAQGNETIIDNSPDEPPATAEKEPDAKTFGAWVKAQRTARGWKPRDFADRAGISYSTVQNLEVGRFSPRRDMRERIIAAFNAHPVPNEPEPTHLTAEDSYMLRSRFIGALLDRNVSQYLAAAHMDAPRSNIRDMMKDPFYLIPIPLAAKLTAWLENAPTTVDQPPVDQPPVINPQPLPTEEPVPVTVTPLTATPNVDDLPVAQVDIDDRDALSEIERDLAGPDDQASPDTRQVSPDAAALPRLRMFTHISVRITPPPGEFSLVALLDKFPDYADANHPRWFDSFDKLTAFAQATAAQSKGPQ